MLSKCAWTLLQDGTSKEQSVLQTVHLDKPKSPLSENSSMLIQEEAEPDAGNPDILKLSNGKYR